MIADARASGALSAEGAWMFRILVLAAGLWLTEAIPAYATAMLIMGLELLFLSTATGSSELWEWSEILEVWGSPLIWLFFGGFLIAEAFREAGLDRIVAKSILARTGKGACSMTVGLMLVTYVLSMFMSNTATITVVIAIISPLLRQVPRDNLSARGMLLGLALAASLGGMATIVGTPPNAIAVANLAENGITINFLQWMKIAGPPSLLLLMLCFGYIWLAYFKRDKEAVVFDLGGLSEPSSKAGKGGGIQWKLVFVVIITLGTIGMWMTQSFHHIHPTVVVFFAITLLTLTGVLTSVSLMSVPWDVLILMAGGLALGKGISVSGLADFFSQHIPDGLSAVTLGLVFAFVAVMASNFMSNTAAANAIIPLIFSAVAVSDSMLVVIPATLACSCATLLPVSTPPNAICYATGKLRASDFYKLGFVLIVLGPGISFLWCRIIL
ncbi:MAG: SLC13 family permease [Akkermansiaceae bacterium]